MLVIESDKSLINIFRPGQTSLPLNHDDFQRFLPEMQRSGMQSSFPGGHADLHKINDNKFRTGDKVGRNHVDNMQKERRSQSSDSRLSNKPRPQSMAVISRYRDHNDQFQLRQRWKCDLEESKVFFMFLLSFYLLTRYQHFCHVYTS